MRPLVAIAQGTPACVNHDNNSRAPGKRTNAAGKPFEGGGVKTAQAFDAFDADLESGFAEQLIGEEAAAHADLAMDTPNRQLDAFGVERLLPRENVLIDAIDQRAVEIEQERRLDAHRSLSYTRSVAASTGWDELPAASSTAAAGIMFRPHGFGKPVRRPEERAAAIAVCCSPAAGYTTDVILDVLPRPAPRLTKSVQAAFFTGDIMLSSSLRFPIDGRARRMFVDGAWVDARSGRTFETRNPATGEVIGVVPRAEAEDVELAVQAARRAFEGPWSRFKPYERQVLLLRIAELFEKHWEEISLSDTTDMGMPIVRTRANKNRVIGMLRYYAGMATSLHGHTIDNSLAGEIFSYTRKEPVGVVGAIIPWNAPTAASIWKIGPALATGCTIVLKPSEEAPLTPLLIADIMNEAGVPPGVVNVVTGTGAEAGAPLAEHLGVDKIVFTGSTATGQSIVRASAGNLKRVSLELGGKSPVIVCADADLEKAVPIAAMAVFANSGQICIAGSRLLVERSIHDAFVERLSVFARALRVGDGADPSTEIGPLISLRQLERVEGFLDSGKAQGARLVSGGGRIVEGDWPRETSWRRRCSRTSPTTCASPRRKYSARSFARCRSIRWTRPCGAPTTRRMDLRPACSRAT